MELCDECKTNQAVQWGRCLECCDKSPSLMTPTTRSDLARLVPPDGLIIELGVAAGIFAEELLTNKKTT